MPAAASEAYCATSPASLNPNAASKCPYLPDCAMFMDATGNQPDPRQAARSSSPSRAGDGEGSGGATSKAIPTKLVPGRQRQQRHSLAKASPTQTLRLPFQRGTCSLTYQPVSYPAPANLFCDCSDCRHSSLTSDNQEDHQDSHLNHPQRQRTSGQHRRQNRQLKHLEEDLGLCGSLHQLGKQHLSSAGSSLLSMTPPSQHYLTIEELKSAQNSCWLCGCNWQEEHISLDCPECGGYSLQRPCPSCDGECKQVWRRNITGTHDRHRASWIGHCNKARCNTTNSSQQLDEERVEGRPLRLLIRTNSSCCSSQQSSAASSDSELDPHVDEVAHCGANNQQVQPK